MRSHGHCRSCRPAVPFRGGEAQWQLAHDLLAETGEHAVMPSAVSYGLTVLVCAMSERAIVPTSPSFIPTARPALMEPSGS